jgi:hypothetical protein
VSLSAIPKALRTAVLERDAGRCTYCGVLQVGQSAVFHIDHVIPRSKGGVTSIENLVLQCPYCSLRKANKTEGVDPTSGQGVSLFHPLRERWEDHFTLTLDGEIEGKSAVGRGTVEALMMNHPWPRSARALQIAAGWIEV